MRLSLVLHSSLLSQLLLTTSFAQTQQDIVQAIRWTDTSVTIQHDPFDPDNHTVRLAIANIPILKAQILSHSHENILEFISNLTPSKAPLSQWKKYRSSEWHVEFLYPPDCHVSTFNIYHAPFRGLHVNRKGGPPIMTLSFRNRTLDVEAHSWALPSAQNDHDMFSDGDVAACLIYVRAENYDALSWTNTSGVVDEQLFYIRVRGPSGQSAVIYCDPEMESLLFASTLKYVR